MLRLFFFFLTICYGTCHENILLGCYKDLPTKRTFTVEEHLTADECVNVCFKKYYRYSYISDDGQCICGNYLGEQITNITCSECGSCDFSLNITNVYVTGNLVPGPPRNFSVTNVTERSIRISWQEPESFVEITKYQIKAIILHTYSRFSPVSPEWLYPRNTFKTELITLLSATRYNITLSTKSPNGDGALVYQVIQTLNGDPDSLPVQPEIINRDGSKIKSKLMPTDNNNGPITAYRVIVINSDSKQGFDEDNVLAFEEAKKNNLAYYIAAELPPDSLNPEKIFTVGDELHYGKYYNAPLDPNTNYKILLALVSELNGITKIVYSDASIAGNGIIVLNVNEEEIGDSPAVIIGLSIAIGLLSFMLIAGIIVFIILKSRVINRRQRLADNQELTLQGPMIEVENNGYIHEEDHTPVNHYRNLKQKVRTISSNQLKIEPTNLLGVGKYGRVNSGTIQENNTLIPIAAYNIPDKKMSQESRRTMLHDLDVLIKVGKHENLIGLIGNCETAQVVCVILEYASMNLKDLLLGSRDSLPGRFSNMSEDQALDIAIQVARGMAHLESCKIIHKQLCARSVMISNGFTPKIGSYGIAQFFNHNKIPDYTRWTAMEVFKGQPHNPKSDVWSFSCLLWEICVLGGTPYGNVSNNNEIPDKISKGLRLSQLPYISDDLYQIMLDCWQLDCDERPRFADLIDSLTNLKENTLIPYLNFNLYSNFQYEQFYPDMELAVRPVF